LLIDVIVVAAWLESVVWFSD